jgi:hypothetical protein
LYFDSDIQVGDSESRYIALKKSINNLTIISYYDKDRDFVFDPNRRTIIWKIPFEYNTKIENGEVNVHQEIVIPNSFLKLVNSHKFNMTMNDKYSDTAYFYVDPYNLINISIIHYVPDVNDLFEM